MNEENNVVETIESENLFEDSESPSEESVDETATDAVDETIDSNESNDLNESNEPTEPTEEVEDNPFLKVKFNGEELSFDEETSRTLAQKGLNYDRFYAPLERLARLNGMDVGDYIAKLNDTQVQFEVSKEMDNLRNDPKYEGVSDEVLEEIAHNHVVENIGKQDRSYEEQRQGEADAEQARVQRDIDMFMEEYPEFKNKGPEALDKKVFDYVKKGYTLLEAYNKWSREQTNAKKPQIEAKQKSAIQNEENRKRSLGNTTNAGNADADDFLSGFLNG